MRKNNVIRLSQATCGAGEADDLGRFLRYLADQGRSRSTIESYGRDLRRFAQWFDETNGTPLTADALTATDAREYRQYLLNRKAAPATINRALAALRAFAAWAVEAGVLPADPIRNIRGVQEQEHAPKWLEKKEQAALLREVEHAINLAKTEAAQRQAVRDLAIVVLLLNTGMRISELCALELSDVNLRERKGTVKVRQGKGSKQRIIPINKAARKALDAWLAQRPESEAAAVFIGKRLEPLQPRGVQRMLAEFGRRAGVEVTPHTCRHSFAKRMVDSGVPLDQVATLMGHSSLDTTRIYTTPSEADLAKAVAQVDE